MRDDPLFRKAVTISYLLYKWPAAPLTSPTIADSNNCSNHRFIGVKFIGVKRETGEAAWIENNEN